MRPPSALRKRSLHPRSRATADVCQDAGRCEGDDRPDSWNRLYPAELVAPASALLS